MKEIRIGVTGSEGRLGSELVRQGCIPIECDVVDLDSLEVALKNPPDVLINCAAYTDVDACLIPKNFRKALDVNTVGVENLRQTLPRQKRMIHISTDYVFDGKKGAYKENAKYGSPINSYGYTKWGGEICFMNPLIPGDTLVRTTGLFSASEHWDFVKLVRETLEEDSLQVTKDLRGNQTYVPFLAKALIELAYLPASKSKPIVHIASNDVLSRYEFALMIASVFDLDKELIVPVLSSQLSHWTEPRPTKGGLNVKLARKMGLSIYTALDGLKQLKKDEQEE